MTAAQGAVEKAVAEILKLRGLVSRLRDNQVRSAEYKQLIKATALSWFNNHRTVLAGVLNQDDLRPIDDIYRQIIEATGHATMRTKYTGLIKSLVQALGSLQVNYVVSLSQPSRSISGHTPELAPDFSSLVSDPKMQAILVKRWNECGICVRSSAPLAATVMMGGLLEGLLLAKINQLIDKNLVFSATTSPKDHKTGRTLQLKDWGLKNFIDVAHELQWITKTAKDVGEVVRDYRNFIHPQKELSHGIVLEPGDAQMLWEVAKSITRQLL